MSVKFKALLHWTTLFIGKPFLKAYLMMFRTYGPCWVLFD